MKLEVQFTNGNLPEGPTPAVDIPVGTVFFGNIKREEPGVFLRIFEGIVNLKNPRETWTFSTGYGPGIENYRPATVARLVVG